MAVDEFNLRRNFIQEKIGDGVAIIFNAKEVTRNNDCSFKFRSDSYFHYFANFPEPNSVLFIVGGNKPRSILFCREKNADLEIENVEVSQLSDNNSDSDQLGNLNENIESIEEETKEQSINI